MRPNTAYSELERLKQITNSALKHKLILQDPFDEFDLPYRQRSKCTALIYDQIQANRDLDQKLGSRLLHTRNYSL